MWEVYVGGDVRRTDEGKEDEQKGLRGCWGERI